jgi:hypothetical protein
MQTSSWNYYTLTVWMLQDDDKWINKWTMSAKFRSVDPFVISFEQPDCQHIIISPTNIMQMLPRFVDEGDVRWIYGSPWLPANRWYTTSTPACPGRRPRWLNATCHGRTHFVDALWCDNPTVFVVDSGFCFRGAYVDFWKEFIEIRL